MIFLDSFRHRWAINAGKENKDIKTLFIVRHAKSSWSEPHLSDHDRPLNKRGRRDAPFMAQFCAKRIEPGLESKNIALLSSTAVRAHSTAMEFAKALGMDKDAVFQEEDLYLSDEMETLDIVKTAPDDYDTLMLFGHNPGFTYFANRLCELQIDNIPTCGVVCARLNIDKWMDTAFGKGEKIFFEYPKKYYKEPLSE